MGKYLIKRLLMGVVTLFVLITVTFFIMHAIPGSPFAGETGRLPSDVQEALTDQYALGTPIHTQYFKYLGNVIRGDFGVSLYRRGRNVADIIRSEIAYTARLGAVAFCIAVLAGVFLGTAAAFSRQRWVSGAAAFIAAVGTSFPSFLLAMLMMMLFGVLLRWLPIVGLSSWKHYIMPGIALALAPIAMISRLTKTSLMGVMKQEYMVLAKSKGTAPLRIITRHALKNALIPVVTYMGSLMATLLTGSFIVETLFSIPGIGAEFVNSISNRDYTVILALIALYGTFVILCNIVTDLITAVLDPRIRLK